MPGPLRTAALHVRAAQRVARRARGPLRARLGPLDERLVFVFGSPRSGTTFLARSIGSLDGFVDLGEVAPLKAAIPDLAVLPSEQAAERVRRILSATRRLGLIGSLRAVEQTPETAFVANAVALAFPAAGLVHIVRDGRDVVCSLLERGWLSAGRGGGDDAWLPYGAEARFWVEPERTEEFTNASDARRAAWAWRRYASAALDVRERALELRYERMAAEPDAVAEKLAHFLQVPAGGLAQALRRAHSESVGRYRDDLTPDQLEEVMDEAGDLLREFGYVA
jgi:hypothetical protein